MEPTFGFAKSRLIPCKEYIEQRNRLIPKATDMANCNVSPRQKIKWAKEFMRCMIICAIDAKLVHPDNLTLFDMKIVKGVSE